jgi:acetylxylan esterase
MVYGDGTQLIGYSAVGVGHTVPVHETVDLAWFCISAACAGGTTTSSVGTTTSVGTTLKTSTTSPPATTTATGGSGGTIAEWGQW